jgi:hypothetical protein
VFLDKQKKRRKSKWLKTENWKMERWKRRPEALSEQAETVTPAAQKAIRKALHYT